MFRANKSCTISKANGKTDVFGTPLPRRKVQEKCAVVRMNIFSGKSSVRADTSASRGNARELETDALLLLTKNTTAEIDDTIEVAGSEFLIMSKFPRFDLLGALDHYEITCTYWTSTK